MKDHYDFSKGERGKFFIGNEPYDVVIHVDRSKPRAKFEVFSDPDGKYRFRLATASTVIFTSEQVYDTKTIASPPSRSYGRIRLSPRLSFF
jgi:hypothetical protein